MSGRILFGAALSAVLFTLAVGPSAAPGSHATGPGLPVQVGPSPGAGAPWFISEVDTAGDTGLHASVAYDPSRDAIYVSYFDATNGHLKYLTFNNPNLLVHQTYTIDKGIQDVSATGLYPSLAYSPPPFEHLALR
jgi:hypothetical protein